VGKGRRTDWWDARWLLKLPLIINFIKYFSKKNIDFFCYYENDFLTLSLPAKSIRDNLELMLSYLPD
jgi:hypothetical protein